MSERRHSLLVEELGMRLEQAVSRCLPDLAIPEVRRMIEAGAVSIDGATAQRHGWPLRVGQRVTVRYDATQVARGAPSLAILYEDEDLVVVDKPSGVAAAPTQDGSAGDVLDHLGRRDGVPHTYYAVHRLDQPTSGVLLVAKTRPAAARLSETFRRHDLRREYLAIVQGRLEAQEKQLTLPIQGRPALSIISAQRHFGQVATLVRARLETGRTHQLRIQLSAFGYPIYGERRHRSKRAPGQRAPGGPGRLALHAERLCLAHPVTGVPLEFYSPLPPDLQGWLEALNASSS